MMDHEDRMQHEGTGYCRESGKIAREMGWMAREEISLRFTFLAC